MSVRPSDQIVHKAAWLYYAHGMRQDEVAQALDISRASVATYLRRARETGIVTISASPQLFADDVLARRIEDRFGLKGAWVVPAMGSGTPLRDLALAAASVFLSLVNNGMRVGVAWGQTVYAIADLLPHADLRDVTVVELCGNMGAPYAYRPDECIMEIARRLNAKGHNFYAPLVMSSPRLAEALRREPVIREQFDSIARCDLSLFSIGTLDEDSHVVRCGAVDHSELVSLRSQGAAGVVAGRIIDGTGQSLDCAYNDRLISAELKALCQIPRRMVVCPSADRLQPLRAALAGGLCTHLVLPHDLAEPLLAMEAPHAEGRS